ncbi:MAG: beta-ketoacyl-ACP synthase III, partial [Thermoanaerobaculia bacterium]|nr:beta-ketoacyl-ACP synthase III [Thermoanaerobaculia bacterium]
DPHDDIGLLGLGSYVPERVMTNDDWSRLVDTTDEWITERTGIKTRRIADRSQSTVDLAEMAAKRALEDAGLEVDAIDELIVATDTPEVFVPDSAAYLQHRLGLGPVPAYDLAGSGCAGFLLALDVARARSRPDRRILVVGVELLTRLMNWEDRNTCVLFGDAAGAAVVGRGDDAVRILAAASGTDGSQADILTLEAGGTRVPFDRDAAEKGLHHAIVMKGREVFREAVRHMSEVSLEVLEMAGLELDDVALVVPHQANLRILNAVAGRLGLDEEQMFVNVDEYGNTGSASVPLALDQARAAGRIQPGDVVLLTSFGAGFHWTALVLQF